MLRIIIALISVAIGLAASGAAAGNGSDREFKLRISQYCAPEDQIPDVPTLYC